MGLRKDNENCEKTGHESASKEHVSYKSGHGTYKTAAVVADSKVASDIGNDILQKGGNAVDAAVAALFTTGAMSSHSAGIGGGSFYIIYDKDQGWHSVDSRETAPAAATVDMFAAPENKEKSTIGGLAIGIPGEVKGLYEVHKKFGRVPWRDVVMPTIKLCEDGVPLTTAVHIALGRLQKEDEKRKFGEYFDSNLNVKPVGSLIRMPKLARTFQTIADDPMSFYNGSLAQDIIADIQEEGGIITLEDLKNYSLKWSEPTQMQLPNNFRMYSTPPPGSGPVLAYILNILSGYNFSPESVATDEESALTHHRLVEAMKFAYGKRTELGDENFIDVSADVANMTSRSYGERTRKLIDDETTHDTAYYHPSFALNVDEGTAHLSVMDAQGNAVSITATINTYFGCRVKGKRTGIIFNSEMDDFSTPDTINYFGLPASPSNFIQPGKRPMSSMCPAIIWDENKKRVRLVTGAAGGSKITTAVAMNIIDTLWLGMPLPASVDRKRVHHQLIPTELQVESDLPPALLQGFLSKNHVIKNMFGFSVIQAIEVQEDGMLVGVADYRKGGQPNGY